MYSTSILSTKAVHGAHAGMFLWALIVGISFPAVGLLSQGLPPLLLTAIRFAIAASVLGAFVWRAPDRWPSLPGLALYAVMGLCLSGFFGAMFWAAHQISALSMSALYVSVPLIAYACGRLFGVERPDPILLAALILGAAGALSLAWTGNAVAASGIALGQAEAVFFLGCGATALYPVLSKWGLQRGWLPNSAALRTFWSLVSGGLLIGALGLVVEPAYALTNLTLGDGLLVAYLGVFSSGVTFWLMQRGTGALTPSTVTAYTYLIPLVSILLLFVAAPESLGWQWLPGIMAVVLAMAVLLRRSAGAFRSTAKLPEH